MQISQISMQNFRNVGELRTYKFNPRFTAVIGINGKGKSTILQALRVACGAFFHSIPVSPKIVIHDSEVRQVSAATGHLAEKRPVIVEATGILGGGSRPVVWRRRILENSNTNTSSAADIGVIRDWGQNLYNQVNQEENDKIDLPVLAFFGTNRIFGAGRVTQNKKRTGRQIFKDGYNNWHEMRATTYQYADWLGSYDTFLGLGKEYVGTKDAFFTAVTTANRYIRDLTFINGALWFAVQMNEKDPPSELLPIWLHSDGIQFFTGLVAELAYRCIVLNGYKGANAVKDSSGIVMIDELDLHLHPNWQRHIIGDLKAAFTALQFIIATHSPFIIQSMGSDELINLDDANPLTFEPDTLPLDKVATEIMKVPSVRSEDFEIKFQKAQEELSKIERDKGPLTTDDYIAVSKVLGTLIEDQTNDATLKAFIQEQDKEDEA